MIDRFSDLPADLLHQILIRCSISTVLTVRSCSKHLNALTRDKYLWIQILKLVCLNIQLFFPSYPVDEMDVMEIEDAATAYLRFPKRASQTWDQDPDTPIPHVRSILLKPPRTYKMTSVSVVRGGRFLLTLDGTTMYLWDLWKHWDKPVASEKDAAPIGVRGHPCEYFDEKSDRLIVRITLGPHDKQYTWYTLYEIYPASDNPTFKLLAKLETLRFQAGPCHFDLESGTVALLQDDGHHMWVWFPFEQRDEASGEDGLVEYPVDHTWDVVNLGSHMILLKPDLRTAAIHSMPEPPRAFRSPRNLPLFPPISGVNWVSEIQRLNTKADLTSITYSNWRPSSLSHVPQSYTTTPTKMWCVDVIARHEDNSVSILHKSFPFAISPLPGNPPQPFPLTLHTATYRNFHGGFRPHEEPNTATLPGGVRLIWFGNGLKAGEIRLHISNISNMSEGHEDSSVGGVLYAGPARANQRDDRYTFCPASGVFATITDRGWVRVCWLV